MVSTMITQEDCRKILGSSEPEILSYKIEKFSNQIVGYLGGHFRLIVQTAKQTRTFFVKTLPQGNHNQSDYVRAIGVFDKEVLLYENLLSELLKIARFAPKCHLAKRNQCIVLDDLSASGYRTCASDFMDLRRCKSLLKTLAQFHATSLIYEETRSNGGGTAFRIPDKFAGEILEATFSFVDGHPRQKWTVNCVRCLGDLLQQLEPDDGQRLGDKLHEFVFGKVPDLIRPSRRFRNVVTHDDLWLNNILFDNVDDCLLVDFQLARYVPPMVDVLQALYLCLDGRILSENFHGLLDEYFDHLAKQLREHQCENVLSREEFWKSLGVYRLLSLVEAAMYATIVYISEELSDLVLSDADRFNEFTFENRSKYIVRHYQENKVFRDRIGHVLKPLIVELRKE